MAGVAKQLGLGHCFDYVADALRHCFDSVVDGMMQSEEAGESEEESIEKSSKERFKL